MDRDTFIINANQELKISGIQNKGLTKTSIETLHS